MTASPNADVDSGEPAFDLAVVGLGYVGLALVEEAVGSGLRVAGLDSDVDRVGSLCRGVSPIVDLSDDRLVELLDSGLVVTADAAVLSTSAAVLVCVPTPLDDAGVPELDAVHAAMTMVGQRLRPGTLVVLESTSYPGTTERIVRPVLEEESGLRAGIDFHLAYSPERINPGDPLYGLRTTPKVVGGLTSGCREAATCLYTRLVDRVVPVSGTGEAEMAKLLENTYRQVNIALVNEMVMFSRALGVDLWEVIDAAATKPFGFEAFKPGPGVGGHCIPVDPSYLSFAVRRLGYPFRFVELAQEINGRMPVYLVTRITEALNDKRLSVRGSRVLLLGVTYKADVADTRQTPALPLATALLERGAEVSWHDPFVADFEVEGVALPRVGDPGVGVGQADLVVLLQTHSAYDIDALAAASSIFLDTRGVASGDTVERL